MIHCINWCESVAFWKKLRDLLVPFRLPRRLFLKAEGCDGEVNAWYDDGAITVCYEFLDWVWQSAPNRPRQLEQLQSIRWQGLLYKSRFTKPDTQCLTS